MRAYRVHRKMGIHVRQREWKRLIRAPRGPMPLPSKHNEAWGMGFFHDGRVDGRRLGALTIVALYTREAPDEAAWPPRA